MEWHSIPSDLPTPSLVIAKDIVRTNLSSMQDYCNQNGLRLRPHTKTHKSQYMGKWQMDSGASGLTVAKVGEAEVMAAVSDSILIAYPPIGSARIARVIELAKKVQLIVGVDSIEAATMLASASVQSGVKLDVLLDIDVGFRRTGVIEKEKAIEVSCEIHQLAGLRFQGLMCFPGNVLPTSDPGVWDRYDETLTEVIKGLARLGVPCPIVSGGSTPTARHSHRVSSLTEIRPGTYIYNDWNEVRLGVCTAEQCAARVRATVVSRPEKNKIVVDAGSKTLSSDRNAADPDSGWGFLPDFPNAKVARLSEEHGEITIAPVDLQTTEMPGIGDAIWIVPNHICVAVNLQNAFYLADENGLSTMQVDARGMLV